MTLSRILLPSFLALIAFISGSSLVLGQVASEDEIKALNTKDLQIKSAKVSYMDILTFWYLKHQQRVKQERPYPMLAES